MTIRREFYVDTSEPGNTKAACVDVPHPQSEGIIIVDTIECFIGTTNGRKKIGAKDLIFERYAYSVTDYDSANPIFSSVKPLTGPNRTEVSFLQDVAQYNSIRGRDSLQGLGLRIRLNDKDRRNDTQYLNIGIETLSVDDLR